MLSYIILEDEPAALRLLKRLVNEIRPDWEFKGSADSITTGIELCNKGGFDLILSDIELSDGDCFQVYSSVDINVPIIFITAYDEYAIKAFNFNSIHYLLKPIKIERLNRAFQKLENNISGKGIIHAGMFKVEKKQLVKKLVSKLGNKTSLIDLSDIAYINFYNRTTIARLFNAKDHILDHSLEKLMAYLPSNQFFRINRQAIINKNTVIAYFKHSSNRLKIECKPGSVKEMIVSKEKSPAFKKWINQTD